MKTITVALKVQEMLHGVLNETYLISEAARTEENREAVSRMQAVEGDENAMDKIMSSMDRSASELIRCINSFAGCSSAVNAASNGMGRMADNESYIITLSVDSRFNDAMVQPLATLMHSFIVNDTVSSWLTPFGSQVSQIYDAEAVAALYEIKKSFMKVRPSRPAHVNS